jgi:hypothetical protein
VPLPCDSVIGVDENRLSDASAVSGQLDAVSTGGLVRSGLVYHGGIDDVFLAALGLSLGEWSRSRYGHDLGDPVIALEGHGREGEVDVGRTLGWFTSVFPVRLEVGDLVGCAGSELGRAIMRVKECLRALPDKGLGYGVLRYLDEASGLSDPGLFSPEVVFNYLGRFDHDGVRSGGWQFEGTEFVASGDDPLRRRLHLLEINALIDSDGVLRVIPRSNKLRPLKLPAPGADTIVIKPAKVVEHNLR